VLTNISQEDRYDSTFSITISEVSYERRTWHIAGRDWNGSTEEGKQEEDMCTNRLDSDFDDLFCDFNRRGRHQEVWVIGTSLPRS
jgi:hypothetical protein